MTTYADYSDTDYSDTDYSDPAESTTSCCCGPADVEPTYQAPVFDPAPVVDYTGADNPTSVWLEAEPQVVTEAPAYSAADTVDASAVIPTGQPGGPEVATVDTTTALYPSVATIGGNDIGGMTIVSPDGTDAGLYPAYATIGGNDLGGVSIVAPDGTTYDSSSFGPSHAVVGPMDPNSTMGSLASAYGIAAQNGDIMSQILLTKTISSIQASAGIWTI